MSENQSNNDKQNESQSNKPKKKYYNKNKKYYSKKSQPSSSNQQQKKENPKQEESNKRDSSNVNNTSNSGNANNARNNSNTQNSNNSYKGKKTYQPRSNKNYYNKKKDRNIVYEVCPFCSREIREPLTAIKVKETDQNAHFECIVSQLKKDYPLEDREKLYYLGGGSFGIVMEKRIRNRKMIVVKERIQYNERANKKGNNSSEKKS